MDFPIRINKYLAEQKLASRREADAMIRAGDVFINGTRAELGAKVGEGDTVEVRGTQKELRYYVYNKPRGVITHAPAAHEEDIETRIKNDHGLTGVYPVGRLDKDSEGLIVLTNDGRITKPLLEEQYGREKEYEVEVDKRITPSALTKLEQGVNIEGYMTKPATVKKLADRRFTLTLTEGKKHQIRRMCAALGYQVTRLRRKRIMHLERSDLTSGDIRELTGRERATFLRELGLDE